jgi:hypothetical protein
MATFDPVAVAVQIVAQNKADDTLSDDAISKLVGVRLARPDDSYAVGKALELERLRRVGLARDELLKVHKVFRASGRSSVEHSA